MRFRKKPVVIAAVQFDPTGFHRKELPAGVEGIPSPGADNWGYEGCTFFIETLKGRLYVQPYDWIIRDGKGEFYPCKPDIFALTYEPEQSDKGTEHQS